jgi:magnesium transporter
VPHPSSPQSQSKASALQMPTTWSLPTQPGSDHPIGWPTINTSTIFGISAAIAGNVLISLALNTQKLAHKRVETAKKLRERGLQTSGSGHAHVNGNRTRPNRASVELDEEERIEDPTNDVFVATAVGPPGKPFASETEPLLGGPNSPRYNAGSRPHPPHRERRTSLREGNLSPVDVANETNVFSELTMTRYPKFSGKRRGSALGGDNGKESDYLKSKLWYALLWTPAFSSF